MTSKVVITGTGRCGTSFLMQLLSNCGINTGYTAKQAKIAIERIDGLNGGIEHDVSMKLIKQSEYIKNPQWVDVDKFKELEECVNIRRVFIPIRDLEATAKSRELMTKQTHGGYGGFWRGANNVNDQKNVNARLIYNLVNYLVDKGIRFNFISFEKMMKDSFYLFRKLEINDLVTLKHFQSEYDKLVDPNKIRF